MLSIKTYVLTRVLANLCQERSLTFSKCYEERIFAILSRESNSPKYANFVR